MYPGTLRSLLPTLKKKERISEGRVRLRRTGVPVQGERKPESRKKWKMKAGWWGMAWEARGGGRSALGLQPGIQLGARLGTPVAQASLYVQCLK